MVAGKLIRIVGRMFVGQAQSREDDFTKDSAENVRGYSLQAVVVPYPVRTFDGLGRRSRFLSLSVISMRRRVRRTCVNEV